ncbi:MAG: hypothetical protein GY940_35800, partial [bacterium]|nr:hypothetical protein [bacterium]
MNQTNSGDNRTGLEIAVIGMAGRFPGAKDLDRFWDNLKNGVESLNFFSTHELEAAGVQAEEYDKPEFVKAVGGILDGKDRFDASFFGYSPAE